MKKLKNRKILLVGGAGFIGHHLAINLKFHGAEVIVLDSLMINNYYHYLAKRHITGTGIYLKLIQQRLDLLKEHEIKLIQVDARDYTFVNYLICETGCDTLIHLAAVAHANKSNKDPYSTFDHSIRTLENTLDTARTQHCAINHFIFFSSSMVYGNFNSGTVTEKTTCDPIGIYGALKYCAEKILKSYNDIFGLDYTIIRPSALYGERCVSRRVGQIFIEQALKGEHITVTGDGSDRLDFTYIDDLVAGIINVLEHKSSRNQIFNLTYGEARTIGGMVDIIKEYFPNIDVRYNPKDRLIPDRGTLDVSKAKKMLGYNPQYPLERGYRKYIEWYINNWKHLTC